MNDSIIYGHELLGRGTPTTVDRQIGVLIITLSVFQLVSGAFTLYVLVNMSIFRNPFGVICAVRTSVEMLASLLHAAYSGPVTITQINAFPPAVAMVVGYFSYALMGIACMLHVNLSLNRCVAVYFPIQYRFIFSDKNCKFLIAFDVVIMSFLASLFYIVPCNAMGYSASHLGYIILDCADGSERPFPIGTVLNFICQYALCFGAITVDLVSLVKIAIVNRKRQRLQDAKYNRNVRFFAQSAFQNFPMLLHVVFMSVTQYSTAHDMEIHRILTFLLGRLADFINSTTIVLFNPEAWSFLKNKWRSNAVSVSTVSL